MAVRPFLAAPRRSGTRSAATAAPARRMTIAASRMTSVCLGWESVHGGGAAVVFRLAHQEQERDHQQEHQRHGAESVYECGHRCLALDDAPNRGVGLACSGGGIGAVSHHGALNAVSV